MTDELLALKNVHFDQEFHKGSTLKLSVSCFVYA